MKTNSRKESFCAQTITHLSFLFAIMILSLVSAACGGDSVHMGATSNYPPGSITTEEMERRLKFDARVEDFKYEGNGLVVDVTEAWVTSPPGIQERALGEWFGMLHATKASADGKTPDGLKVIARHQGSEVATWTPQEGFRQTQAPKSGEKAARSAS